MRKIITKPWVAIISIFVVATINKFVFGLFPLEIRPYLHDITEWLYIAFTLLLIYSIGWNIFRAITGAVKKPKEP